jgi:hypothetical protein
MNEPLKTDTESLNIEGAETVKERMIQEGDD